MGVNHGGLHVLVAEKFLHRSDVVSTFQELRGERMPKGVACDAFDPLALGLFRAAAVVT